MDHIEMFDIKKSFDKLELVEQFDPFDFNSGLVGHLENQTKKTRPAASRPAASRATKKSKYQPVVFI